MEAPDLPFEVTCSGGTYVRSLAADLGLRLGPGAHLRALRRLSSGPFQVKDAAPSGMLNDPSHQGRFRKAVRPLSEALPQMRDVEVDASMARKIRNGYQPQWKEVTSGLNGSGTPRGKGHIKLTHEEALIAILSLDHCEADGRVSARRMRVFT
jgi:tRNA pseudouridine55 synthase